MTGLTCGVVRRRLPAFHDDELEVREQIAIQNHLDQCPPCLTEARVLHGEGMTMDQIAKLFGVTRQRVSALLRE